MFVPHLHSLDHLETSFASLNSLKSPLKSPAHSKSVIYIFDILRLHFIWTPWTPLTPPWAPTTHLNYPLNSTPGTDWESSTNAWFWERLCDGPAFPNLFVYCWCLTGLFSILWMYAKRSDDWNNLKTRLILMLYVILWLHMIRLALFN